ncbi:c-type cytochrome [Rheinheimera nanhaiensis]|uniref:Cytochrome c-554 n=1 Tax=Rheinheimera nanhaiensis E407-8 TaxID=562729 RepID=I1DUG5_9GAMM|nr:cytochrome c [Rheinheimera nanhaiensis]GAB57693.1 cytochrome c-554 [Rheinheimera nanhaiensis E407-8]
MKHMLLMTVMLLGSAGVAAADIDAGKAKAAVCAACHGANGISVIPDYPNLAGQKVRYLEASIKAYRDGERKNPIMSPMASGLSDADIANIAAFYASLPAGG